MPAKSKNRSTNTKKKHRASSKSPGVLAAYFQQRDHFYQKHPRVRVLLGLLIVSFAMAIGVLYYNKTIVFIGLTLDSQYGIRYPYVDAWYVQKK